SREVWGMVTNEALAAGLHVVVSDVCGVVRNIKHMNGVFVVSNDLNGLSNGMRKSKETWNGPISQPEILQYSWAHNANIVLDAVSSTEHANLVAAPPPGALLWLTNIPTPYRIWSWTELNTRTPIQIFFAAFSERNRHWDLSKELVALDHKFLSLPRIRLGESAIYLPSLSLLRGLRSREFDTLVVDGWESPAYHVALRWAKRRGWRTIVLHRSTLDSQKYSRGPIAWLRKSTLGLADRVVTAGTDSTKAAVAAGVDRSRIIEVFNNVDTEWFSAETSAIRSRLDALHEQSLGRVFLYVGQFIPRKNVSELIAAFNLIRTPDDKLVLVGDGPLRLELEAQVFELGLAQSVEFRGSLEKDRLAAVYAESHTLVLPSTSEVWGLVVNEAAASSLQIVVSESCGVAAEVLGEAGVWVVHPSTTQIAAAMAETTIERIPLNRREKFSNPAISLAAAILLP
ncbi:MAG: glycosyltransferase, partial [Verrucomicrobiaceae bacterium]